jgi:multicomponent Na+:H+ antiporter subunit F
MIVALALGGLLLAGSAAVVRLLRGPTLADRVAALDVALVSLMSAMAVGAVERHSTIELDFLVVIAVVGFTATVAASRFIEDEDPEQ